MYYDKLNFKQRLRIQIFDHISLFYLFVLSVEYLFNNQASKSCWWMPWHREAMKDMRTCDKLWGAGKRL